MRCIKKCPTIIYRIKKYRDSGIPRYFVTSSIINNFCKNPTSAGLSPILFAIYVNDIIHKLSASGRGCHVAGIYVGVLVYADDLLLISSIRSDLSRRMR